MHMHINVLENDLHIASFLRGKIEAVKAWGWLSLEGQQREQMLWLQRQACLACHSHSIYVNINHVILI